MRRAGTESANSQNIEVRNLTVANTGGGDVGIGIATDTSAPPNHDAVVGDDAGRTAEHHAGRDRDRDLDLFSRA